MPGEQHLEKAARHLKAAQANMELGFHEVAVNRSYYAAFEAARAALGKSMQPRFGIVLGSGSWKPALGCLPILTRPLGRCHSRLPPICTCQVPSAASVRCKG